MQRDRNPFVSDFVYLTRPVDDPGPAPWRVQDPPCHDPAADPAVIAAFVAAAVDECNRVRARAGLDPVGENQP